MMDLSKYRVEWVGLGDIDYSDKTYQYRKELGAGNVGDLIGSFRETGQKFPIVVRELKGGRKQIVCGFRRFTAAKELGWEKMLAVVVPESDMPDEDAEVLSVDENIKRKSLTSLDLMFMCKKLSDEGKSNIYIGKLIGKSEKQVRRYLSVASASKAEQDALLNGKITIDNIHDGKLGVDAEAGVQNKKMYVKPTKSGFRAVLEFNRKQDDPKAAIEFANGLIKAIKEQIKLIKSGSKRPTIKQEHKVIKELQQSQEQKEDIANLINNPSRHGGMSPNLKEPAAPAGGVPTGEWKPVSNSGLETLKYLPKEMLKQYKTFIDSGNSAVVEAALAQQGITLEQFKAEVEKYL